MLFVFSVKNSNSIRVPNLIEVMRFSKWSVDDKALQNFINLLEFNKLYVWILNEHNFHFKIIKRTENEFQKAKLTLNVQQIRDE